MESQDYIDRLLAAALDSSRHTGSRLHEDVRQVILYGVGGPSDALVSVLDEAPSDVRVIWREAPYTLAELTTEVLRIFDEGPAGLNSGGACHDGTGLVFTTEDPELLGVEDPQAALGTRFPVRIEYGERATPF